MKFCYGIVAAATLAMVGCSRSEPEQPAAGASSAATPPSGAAAGNTAQVAPGDWPLINRDLSANRYSPLTEINTSNVANLQAAWSYQLGGNSTAVPIVIGGGM